MTDKARLPNSAAGRRLGLVLTILVAAFFLMDASMKLLELPIVLATTADLGWPPASAQPLGLVLLAVTALYAFPRTSPWGAVLLTAYLGGAVATHARIGSPLWSHTLFGVYLAVAAWSGLVLRNPNLWSIFLGRAYFGARGEAQR